MDEPSQADSEARIWAMVAQLAFFANVTMPFGGVVATALIFALRKDREPVARENQRSALNFEITVALLNAVLLLAYFFSFFSMFFTLGSLSATQAHGARTASPPGFLAVPFAFFGVFMLVGLASAVVSCLAARTAWLGRPVRYPVAVPFVR